MLSIRPKESLAEHEAARGVLYRTDPDACCALRKVAPLDDALRGYRAWATGLRRDDNRRPGRHPDRRLGRQARAAQARADRAGWTDEDVDGTSPRTRTMIINPLLQMGYRSIGCGPCTRAVAAGRGRPCRPVGGPGQDGVRHPPLSRSPSPGAVSAAPSP